MMERIFTLKEIALIRVLNQSQRYVIKLKRIHCKHKLTDAYIYI